MKRHHLKTLLSKLGVEIDRETAEGWIIGHCPFAPYLDEHKNSVDRSASFCAKASDTRKSGYNCFTCKMHGPIEALCHALGHHRNKKREYSLLAARAAAAEFEVGSDRGFEDFEEEDEKPKAISENVIKGMYDHAWTSAPARLYLKRRGIGEHTAATLGLVYDPDEKRILFPVRDRQNRLFGFTGRTILPKNLWPKRKDYMKVKDYNFKKARFLLGAQLVDDRRPILLGEGLFGQAHMFEIGADALGNPVQSMGSSLSEAQVDILEDWGRAVYMFYDNDEPGRMGKFGGVNSLGAKIVGAVERIGRRLPVFDVTWPRGSEGKDQEFLTYDNVKAMIANATQIIGIDRKRRTYGR